MTDELFMRRALSLARRAAKAGEVPVGCVIVKDGKIIASAYNTRETKKNASHHAELKAIDRACKKLHGWRLLGCEMYVTLEPCPMCAGAIINARIEKVHIACPDPKAGAVGSVLNLFEFPFNHKPETDFGMMEAESRALLQDFFRSLRKKKIKTE